MQTLLSLHSRIFHSRNLVLTLGTCAFQKHYAGFLVYIYMNIYVTSILHVYYTCVTSTLHLYYIYITPIFHLYYIYITSILHRYAILENIFVCQKLKKNPTVFVYSKCLSNKGQWPSGYNEKRVNSPPPPRIAAEILRKFVIR